MTPLALVLGVDALAGGHGGRSTCRTTRPGSARIALACGGEMDGMRLGAMSHGLLERAAVLKRGYGWRRCAHSSA